MFFGCISVILPNVKGSTQSLIENKPGQCPYILDDFAKCDFKCKSDLSCNGDEKCCSNGCGTECVQPLNYTMCQHERTVAQYHIEQSSTKNAFIPVCKDDGNYEDKQCDLNKKECWCVDFRGFEISQTRTSYTDVLECSKKSHSGNCPLYRCKNDCNNGFKLDKNGCRNCACLDPCAPIECTEAGKTCKLLDVQCNKWPCSPIPMCLAPRNNPCIYGAPLKIKNHKVHCNSENPCPFTHMCRSSVYAINGYCCPQKGKCLPLQCDLSCRYGYSYDINECPICECYEPCKTILCPPPATCKVQQVQCIRAPCLPIAQCE